MRRVKYILLLLSVLCVGSAWGQAIRWEMKPRPYASIERYGMGLFEVKSADGKIGLIRSDGTELFPPTADQISPFFNHMAVVLRAVGGRYQILGVLHDDGSYNAFSATYYIIKRQIFFSEGLMTVIDGNGRYGYINDLGAPVLGFDGKWTEIAPFTEGFAAVTGPSGFKLINNKGREVPIVLGLDEIGGGTNVYSGKAVIWNAYGDKFYSFDVKSQKSSKINTPRDLKLDYLHCLQSFTNRAGNPPYVKVAAETGPVGLQPVQSESMWGYRDDDRVYLPAQFAQARPFIRDIAIVQLGSAWGLLRWEAQGAPFSTYKEEGTLKYKEGQTLPLTFRLDVPAAWQNQPLEVRVIDSETGAEIENKVNAAAYTFNYKPKGTKRSFQVSVASEGLQLWNGDVAYSFHKEVEEVIAPASKDIVQKPVNTEPVIRIVVSGTKANALDQVPVTAIVTNPTQSELSVMVTMTGSEAFVGNTTTITLPPGSSAEVVSHFKVTEKVTNQRVEVTTSLGGKAQITVKELFPFY